MAFLNSASLLNMGAADAAKKASSNTPVQEIQANQSDEFAQALRKQLQQANKPASNPATPAVAKNNPPAKETMHAQSAQEAAKLAKNESNKEQPVSKEPAKTTSAKAGDQKATDKPAAENTTVEDKAATTETVALDETPLNIKKRLITNLEATDPAEVGLTPWMQTMLAMRQPSAQNTTGDQAAFTSTVDETALPSAELLLDASATVAPEQAGNPLTTNVAAGVSPEAKTTGISSESPAAEKPAHFSETLGIAKSVAEAVQETIATEKAVDRAGNIDIQSETSNTVTLPAAQALPNSAWLNAAGVSQTSNVMMSQVATPFGNERWQTAINQHVLNMAGSGDDVASLTLSPPDLGPIQVVLKVDNQSVNTSFITDNPLVRQALEDGLQDLRDRMQSQGLELGNTFVGNGQQAEQHFEQQSAKGNGRAAASSAEAETAAAPQTAVKTRVARGLVDTFA
ncbi:MAG: flagellar hook-length control protein FliK [Methylophilus sp.]|uniref:flagellar hook-length control protein FliK n=1 Tax=Methylophilus sp. TaxID=29541 RepID=UPI003FA01B96